MAVIREAIVAFVLISCIVAGVAGTIEDGLPRPANVPDAPTVTYGSDPEVKSWDGAVVDCIWYGFASTLYDADIGSICLDDLRSALTNVTSNIVLDPYVYFYSRGATGTDPVTDVPYCYEGCFNLEGGAQPPSAWAPGYLDSPAPSPGGYIRGPSLAPYYSPEGAPDYAPAPESGLN